MADKSGRGEAAAMIEADGLTKYYGGVRALSDVDLTLHRGEVVVAGGALR